MWFRKPKNHPRWDPIAVQTRWRDTEARGWEAFNKLFSRQPPSKDPNCFYDLCLAELDAVTHLNKQQCFASTSDFIAELKRLQIEPTSPSIPAFNDQAYRSCQKQWLDFVIRSTTHEAKPRCRTWRGGLVVIPALAFLGLGIFLVRPALDSERAHDLGLAQWQAFAGFLLCLFVFGLLCKILGRPAAKAASATAALDTP